MGGGDLNESEGGSGSMRAMDFSTVLLCVFPKTATRLQKFSQYKNTLTTFEHFHCITTAKVFF